MKRTLLSALLVLAFMVVAFPAAAQGGLSGAHDLLSALHRDTTVAIVARGNLIVGQGTSPTWKALSLGAEGYVLTSNGWDIIWASASSGCETCELLANKNQAGGYAGLTADTLLNASQGQEVWSVADLTEYSASSGTGATAVRATITTPATNDVLTWNGANWINQAVQGGSAHALLSATHTDATASNPILGGIIYADASQKWTQQAGNITSTKKYQTQTGTGSVSAAPIWDSIADADLPASIARTNATWPASSVTSGTFATGTFSFSGSIITSLGTVSSGAIGGITNLGIRDTSSSYDIVVGATSSTPISGARALTLDMGDAAHTLIFGTSTSALTFPTGTKTILDTSRKVAGKELSSDITIACSDLSNGATGCSTTVGSIATQASSSVSITGGAIVGLTGLGIRDTSASYDVTIAATSDPALNAGRVLTLNMGNVAHALDFGGTTGTLTFPTGTATVESQGNKNAASGYAGLTASTKLTTAQGQEVWSVTDLTTYATTSGSGTQAIQATITTPTANDVLTWSGTNWINQVVGGAGANTALSNLASVTINAGLVPQTTLSLGGSSTPWQYLYLYGAGSYGANRQLITSTAPTAPRTFTLPDADSNPVRPLTCSGTDKVSAIAATGIITCTTDSSGAGTWTTIVKTADESRVNNTLLDDATLKFTTLANTQYTIRIKVFMVTNATADSKYRMAHTGTTTRVQRRIIKTATVDTAAEAAPLTVFDAADVVLTTTGTQPYVEEDIVLQVGASGGVFSFKWAQNTTNAVAMTVYEGSYLEYAIS